MMSALLLAAALLTAEDKPAGPDIDGKWLIVYAEEAGKPNPAWEGRGATFKGSTLFYSKEGDNRSLKLTFGPDQTVKATLPTGGRDVVPKPMNGVCVVGQDYLCLSLHSGTTKPADPKASSGTLILVLRRQR